MYKPEEEYQVMLERLKGIFQQKNMTQYDLAKATGMSTSSVSSLMKGMTRPYIHTILMICEALAVSIGELFEHRESGEVADEEVYIRAYRCLPSEKRKMLSVYIDMLVQYKGNI